jgi:hypothetical protein
MKRLLLALSVAFGSTMTLAGEYSIDSSLPLKTSDTLSILRSSTSVTSDGEKPALVLLAPASGAALAIPAVEFGAQGVDSGEKAVLTSDTSRGRSRVTAPAFTPFYYGVVSCTLAGMGVCNATWDNVGYPIDDANGQACNVATNCRVQTISTTSTGGSTAPTTGWTNVTTAFSDCSVSGTPFGNTIWYRLESYQVKTGMMGMCGLPVKAEWVRETNDKIYGCKSSGGTCTAVYYDPGTGTIGNVRDLETRVVSAH